MKFLILPILTLLSFIIIYYFFFKKKNENFRSIKEPEMRSELNMDICKPSCCPGTFSCGGKGCICLSLKDRVLLWRRGNATFEKPNNK
jgi:hypothetical protein